ncbi:hypothetical protein LINGRAHAP2_LOCUS11224, partial [Linum grandiflorum]
LVSSKAHIQVTTISLSLLLTDSKQGVLVLLPALPEVSPSYQVSTHFSHTSC